MTDIKENLKKYRDAQRALKESLKTQTALKTKQRDIEARMVNSNLALAGLQTKKKIDLKNYAVGRVSESALAEVRSDVESVRRELLELEEMKEALDNATNEPDTPMSGLVEAERSAYLSVWRAVDSHLQANPPDGFVFTLNVLELVRYDPLDPLAHWLSLALVLLI